MIALGRESSTLVKPRAKKYHPHSTAMAAESATKQCKANYRKREWIAGPPNGWVMTVMGLY